MVEHCVSGQTLRSQKNEAIRQKLEGQDDLDDLDELTELETKMFG